MHSVDFFPMTRLPPAVADRFRAWLGVETRVGADTAARLNQVFVPRLGKVGSVRQPAARVPFAQLCLPGSVGAHGVAYSAVPRLSVSRLLPAYCELQTAYELYGGVAKPTTKRMASGIRAHARLEEASHADVARARAAAARGAAPITPADHMAWLWVQLAVRLLAVERDGGLGAREVVLHGWIAPDATLSQTPTPALVLVSGIVDQLVFRDTFTVVDVKTRLSATVPLDAVQLSAARVQVWLYRYMLETLARDPHTTTQSLLELARRYGHSPAAPLTDACCAGLQEVFGHSGCSLAAAAELLAAAYHHTLPYLSASCAVEYHSGGTAFHVASYPYNAAAVEAQLRDSMLFWQGTRNPQGVDPSRAAVCSYCSFRPWCHHRSTLVS